MEPMAIGNSPSSPNTSPLINPNFLPAFLMGETQTSTPRPTNLSPTRTRITNFKTPTSGPDRIQQRLFSQPPQDSMFNLSAVNDKVGPPARGLFDTLDTRNEFTPNKQFASPADKRNSSFGRNINDSLNQSAMFKKGNDVNWVTVLGFPPHAASLVLAQFAQCGNVIDKRFPHEGNWVNLKYSSKHEVAKALALNGKLISNSIMVGVIPCAGYDNKENSYSDNMMSPNRARPLVQSFMPRQGSSDVGSPQGVPQRSTGFVTKAMEYVFGW